MPDRSGDALSRVLARAMGKVGSPSEGVPTVPGRHDLVEVDIGTRWVIRKLEAAGFEAFVVGGAVRDALLGKKPHDWDLATNATPDQMKKVFPRSYQINNSFGTVSIKPPPYTTITYYTDVTPRLQDTDVTPRTHLDLEATIRSRHVSLKELMETNWIRPEWKQPPDPEGDAIAAVIEKNLPRMKAALEAKLALVKPGEKLPWPKGYVAKKRTH